MTREPVVIGVGLVTAVGLSAAETAASVRAGTARFVESRIQDKTLQPVTLAGVPDNALPPLADNIAVDGLTMREVRLTRLATAALRECARVVPATEPRPPLILALPEQQTPLELNGSGLLARLAAQVPGSFDPQRSDVSLRGRAGGLVAVGHAAQLVLSGHVNFVMAGGIDSYHDLFVLGSLDRDSRVKSESNLDGFIPGEGAAFVMIANRAVAVTLGLRPLCRVTPASIAREAGHLYSEEPYLGEGLAAALQQLIQAGSVVSPIQEVFSSMNGERHWAKEWGVARIRAREVFAEEHGMHHPAQCFGDLGAACGPALAGLGALGISAGYRKSPSLVYASSDGGLRAALIVSAA
jgi:3-oxoacyl-[acyl-carrier-protein] synthase I